VVITSRASTCSSSRIEHLGVPEWSLDLQNPNGSA